MKQAGEKTLLLVEDEAIIALSEKMMLEKHGYTVHAVHSGEKAVETVRENPSIDLVLMDIDLGHGMAGDQAAERILEIRHVPVVFLTSHTERAFVERVKQISRYGYVIKNSGEFVLWDAIEVALELHRTHGQVREREQQYRALFYNSHSPMMLIRPGTGEIAAVNRAACSLYGWVEEEFLQRKVQDINQLDERQVFEEMRRARQQEQNYFLFRHRIASGEIRVVEIRASPITVGGEELLYSIISDVTGREETRAALVESETRYRNLVEEAPVGIFRTTASGTPLSTNLAMARILGFDSAEEALAHYDELGSELYADPERRRDFVRELQATGYVQDFEYEARRRDGSHVWLTVDARRSSPVTGAEFEIQGFATNINERKQTMELIRESERRFRTLVENAPDAIFVQTNHVFRYVNQAALELFGADADEELIGKPVVERFREDFREGIRERIRTLNEDREPVPRIEETCLRLDGTEVSADVSAVPLEHAGDWGALVFVHDLSKEKELERTQREAAEECETVFNGTHDAMFLVDVVDERQFLYVRNNPTHQRLTGISLEQLRNRTPRELAGDRIGRAVEKHYEECVRVGRTVSYEEVLALPAGERTWLTTLTPVVRGGRVEHIVGSSKDITQQRSDQERIHGLLSERDLLLKDAQSRMQSMGVLHEKLYHSGHYRDMPLDEYLSPLMDDLAAMFPERFRIRFEKSVDSVMLDVRSLSSVGLIVTELVTNAMKHAFRNRQDGTIVVTAERVDGRTTLIVEDDGAGSSNDGDTRPGHGFGLTLVQALVQQLSGNLDITSDGNGTRAVISFRVPENRESPSNSPDAMGRRAQRE